MCVTYLGLIQIQFGDINLKPAEPSHGNNAFWDNEKLIYAYTENNFSDSFLEHTRGMAPQCDASFSITD